MRYGKGVYFALTSGYSNAYAGANPKKMFVCRVMAGETSQGYNEQLVPEVRVPATNVMYDSTTDKLQAPEPIQIGDPAARSNVRQMYVVYHDAQAYPEYLIEVRISFLFMIRHSSFVCSFNHCPFHPSTRIKDEHLFVYYWQKRFIILVVYRAIADTLRTGPTSHPPPAYSPPSSEERE